MSMPLIRVEDISVRYGAKTVLSGVSLNIEAGEFVTIAGQTGCGKSTLLRLLLGSERPDSGLIVVDGKAICGPEPQRGYVPQKYSLFPDKIVLDNITFGPEVREFSLLGRWTPKFTKRRKELQCRAFSFLDKMHLHESDAHKYPDQLSGGMQQRVAIAQALMMDPQVLLMDEAFSALDPGTRTSMQRLMREVWREMGTTVVFVTHNLAEAVYLGSRVVVLAKHPDREGSTVALDAQIPEECRMANGYPRRDDMSRFISLIEESTLGAARELQMDELTQAMIS